jgi:hypothetical protein
MVGSTGSNVTAVTWVVIALGIVCIGLNITNFCLIVFTKSARSVSQDTIKLLSSASAGKKKSGSSSADAYDRMLKHQYVKPTKTKR